jgi:DNA polymerase-3 subunit delta
MTFEQIVETIKNKKYAPVYFFQGDEPYYIDKLCQHIENDILNESDKAFNLSVFYGKDVNVSQIIDASYRMPMMAEKQVVLIKEAQLIDKFENESNAELLIKYLQKPCNTTILAFGYKYKKLDARRSLKKSFDKHIVFTSDKIKEEKVVSWIKNYIKESNKLIDDKAAMLLAEYLGNDLAKVENEITKLIINKKENESINTHDIEKNIGISKDYNIFELQIALGKKDFFKTMQIVHYLNEHNKQNPLIVTISTLSSYFTKLLSYHFHANLDKNTIAQKIGVPPYFLNDYTIAAKHYSERNCEKIIDIIHQYDLKNKGVNNDNTSDTELLRELILKIFYIHEI